MELMEIYYYGSKLFRKFLFYRKQRVSYRDSISSLKHIQTGVPQGSVLGPPLFLFIAMMSQMKWLLFADGRQMIFFFYNILLIT
jgi:hypothetical protein